MTSRRVRQSSSPSSRGTAGASLSSLPSPTLQQSHESSQTNPKLPPRQQPRSKTLRSGSPHRLSAAGTHPASPGSRGRAAPSFPRRSWRRWWRCCCCWRCCWWLWRRWQLLRVPAATEERITSRPQPAEVGAQMFPARIGPAGADVARLLGALLGALLGDRDALSITRGRGEGGRRKEGGRREEQVPPAGCSAPGRRMELRAGQAVRSCLGLGAEDGDVKRQSRERGAARGGRGQGQP